MKTEHFRDYEDLCHSTRNAVLSIYYLANKLTNGKYTEKDAESFKAQVLRLSVSSDQMLVKLRLILEIEEELKRDRECLER